MTLLWIKHSRTYQASIQISALNGIVNRGYDLIYRLKR